MGLFTSSIGQLKSFQRKVSYSPPPPPPPPPPPGGQDGTNDISITVTPVLSGTPTSLTSYTNLDTWSDSGYVQDFYYCNQTVDDIKFVVARERGTNRIELWLYRPPVWDYRSSAGSYTAPNQSALMTDVDYDIQISVGGSLITPVYSESTTTRVRMTTGNLRRLVSAFKPWDWSRVDSAISAKRLPRYDIDTLSSMYSDTPSLPKDLRDDLTLRTYNHAILGGTSNSTWWDGVRSGQGGAYASSRGVYHSAEARAISERINGITVNLTAIETHLRGAGEYAGTMPQYIVLDPATFKPYNPQKGSYKWSSTGDSSNQSPTNLPRPYTYNVQTRTSYTFDAAHQYNCGQVAFEATRDPFYALLMQCNSFINLASANSYDTALWISQYDSTLSSQISADSTVWNNLPYYILEQYQYRALTHGIREVVKAYNITSLCPTVGFLQPASVFNTIITDDATYNWSAQATQINAGDLTSSTKSTVINGARKLFGIYGKLFDGGNGTLDNPYKLSYSGLFNAYALGNLFYATLTGRSEYLSHFTRILEGFCDATLNGAGGQRLSQSYPWSTKAGISNTLIPTTSDTGNDIESIWTPIVPAPFSTIAGLVSYWEANADTWINTTGNNFNNFAFGNQHSIGQQFIMILRSVKQLNDQGYWSILSSKVNDTITTLNNQLAATTKYTGSFTNWSIDYTA